MISSRSVNAIQILIYLSERNNGEYISLKNISDSLNISLKYMEQIIPPLVEKEYVCTVRGKQGGYKLQKDPHKITIWEILNIYEKSLYPVHKDIHNNQQMIKMWDDFYQLQKDYFSNKNISDLQNSDYILDYII